MKKQLATLAFALAAAAPSFAAPETFTLDGNHTFPRFSYSHLGFSVQMSRFDKATGTVVLDKAAKTATVDIVIDTKSISTGKIFFKIDVGTCTECEGHSDSPLCVDVCPSSCISPA